MSLVNDPEYGLIERAGEVVSRMTALGEALKGMAVELEAAKVMKDRQERVIRRGPIEIRQSGTEYHATWEPDPQRVEVNGKHGAMILSEPHRGTGPTPYAAAVNLIGLLSERRAWG